MSMTMAEKILARASGQAVVRPGDLVVCDVDVAVQSDASFTGYRMMGAEPAQVFDPDKVILVTDHAVPAITPDAQDAHARMRAFASEFGLTHFYDVGRHGIMHQVLAERGHALPGSLLAAGDSHTCAAGAFNCCARGLGGPEMLFVVSTGKTWFLVGPTVRFELSGTLPDGVFPRDVIHHIAGTYGDFVGRNLEFVGPGAAALSIGSRQTIATMSAEVSAEFALFEADERTLEYVRARTDRAFEPVVSDPDAGFEAVHQVDLSTLSPQVALPGRVPNNVRPADGLHGIKITQAFVGSCANGRLEDLAAVADVLRGRTVHPSVRMIVTPSSQQEYIAAVKAGYVETIVGANAVVTGSSCSLCGSNSLGPDDVCITASTRNFQGRMGSPLAQIYMGSPATVAASAIKGQITDPRDLD
ncbi:MAG: 3-isopropylmalate dehydratase large subunit [Chloroflexi bacterium]|nr:3-isopropylmalate dehydratase large subunit [Chloroflexota bacterium]